MKTMLCNVLWEEKSEVCDQKTESIIVVCITNAA